MASSSRSTKLQSLLFVVEAELSTLCGKYTDPKISRLHEMSSEASSIFSSIMKLAPVLSEEQSETRKAAESWKKSIAQLAEQQKWYDEMIQMIWEWRSISLVADKLVSRAAKDSSNKIWSEVCGHLLKHPNQPMSTLKEE